MGTRGDLDRDKWDPKCVFVKLCEASYFIKMFSSTVSDMKKFKKGRVPKKGKGEKANMGGKMAEI